MCYTKTTTGYSLVEVLVAIAILLIAITGPMTIASKGLQSAQYSREQTQATFLAQSGLEVVVWMRNNNGLQRAKDLLEDGVDDGIDAWTWHEDTNLAACKAVGGCGLELVGSAVITYNCDLSGCLLYKNIIQGQEVYTYEDSSPDAVPSRYTRKIYVTELDANSVQVRSVVTWSPNIFAAERQVVAETILYNIYDFPTS